MPSARTTTGIAAADFQAARIPQCYCVRIDVASPVGTKRYTDGGPSGDVVANIDGSGSQTWSVVGLRVKLPDQGDQGLSSVTSVAFWNADTPPTWSTRAASPGLRRAAVQIWRVWFNPDTLAIRGQYKEFDGYVDNHNLDEWAELVLKPHPWTREAPFLTPVQLGAGALTPDPALPFYFGDNQSRSSGR